MEFFTDNDTNRSLVMKTMFCNVILLMLSFSLILLSQNERESFVTFVEQMQYKDMEASIDWFRKNKYDFDKHKVDENIFNFYRGVARFSSYQVYHGPTSELRLAIKDFYKVLLSGISYGDYYSDRSLLYIAAALMELGDKNDKEISARIFQYFIDNIKTTHPYYTTALFWQTYLGFLDASTYTYNYDTLLELSKNKSILIYDYFAASTKDLSQMINRLESPSEIYLQVYKWTRNSTDIITLIISAMESEKIYDSSNIPNTMVDEQKYAPKPTVALKPAVVPRSTVALKPTVVPKSAQKPKNDNASSSQTSLTASNMSGFRLIVEKENDNTPLRIQIADKTIITRTSKKYTVYIDAGKYNVVSTYNKKSYTNAIVVSKKKINVLTIIAKKPASQESYVKFLITLDGVKKRNNSKKPLVTDALNSKTVDTIKNLLVQDPSLAIKWFDINYYKTSMSMTPEEYAYYRAIAYYKQFLVDGNPFYAAQAKYDLEFVYNKKDNLDTLINTEIYLANIEAYAYGNYIDAERFLVSATKRITDENSDKYFSTIAYWRIRLAVADAREISRLRDALSKKNKTTSILDMKTGNHQILAILYPKIDSNISVLPASRVTAKSFLSSPGKNDKLLRAASELRNIPIYIDVAGKADNATIQFTSINDNRHRMPYEDKLFIGSNKLAINLDNQVFYVDINTNKNEAYSILIVSD